MNPSAVYSIVQTNDLSGLLSEPGLLSKNANIVIFSIKPDQDLCFTDLSSKCQF